MVFGFKNLIKSPGKSFFTLSQADAADMIDAYLSGGSDKFEYEALPEFRLVPNPVVWLEVLRQEVIRIDLEKRTDDERDGLATQEGRECLAELSHSFREGEFR